MSKVLQKDMENNKDYILAKQMNGKKFFRYLSKDNEVVKDFDENGSVEEIRVIKVKNGTEIVILDKDKKEITVSPNYINENKYVELLPVGYLSLSIVTIYTSDAIAFDDVIVAIYNMDDIRDKKSTEPAVVCRQNINDIFYTEFMKGTSNVDYVGVSVSNLTCPANYTMNQMLQCNDVSYNYSIHFYLDDTLDLLLSYINTKKFDKVLHTLYLDYAKAHNIFIYKSKDYEKEYVSTMGHCSNLRTLLTDNNFEYDMDSVFGISKINILLEEHLITIEHEYLGKALSLDNSTVYALSNIYKKNLSNIIIMEYDNDIDIEEFKSSKANFFLLRDSSDKLYLVSYTLDGEFRETDLEVIAASEVMKQYVSVLNNKYKK